MTVPMRAVLSLVVYAAAAALPAHAQTAQRSALVGRVTDPSGAPLAGARVTLSGAAALGGARTYTIDTDGYYRFLALLPGDYQLSAEADGFQPVTRGGLRLPVETTWTIDFRLELPTVTCSATVDAVVPMVDVTTAATPAVLERTLLQNLPTDRTLTAVLNLAPGVTDNVAFGGTQNANGLTVDGVSLVEPVLGRQWVAVHYNWLDAVQVVALGAPAEYGQSTGATANGVLRSGSNRLTGLGEYVAAVADWTGDNTAELERQLQAPYPARELLSWWDANGQIGGPLRKDRLWFFAGMSVVRERYRPFGYSGAESADRDEPQALLKLDGAPASNVRMQGFYQYTSGRVTGEGLAEYARSLETAGERRRRNHTWHARGTWVARSDTTLEGRVAGYTGYSSFGPIDPARVAGPPPINDNIRLLVLDNVMRITDDDRRAVTTSARVTHVRRIGRSLHDMAAGLEVEAAASRTYQGFPAGRIEQYFDGVYRASIFWDGNDLRTRNARTTLYLQDRWDVGRGLTLEPGLRVEWYAGRPREGGTVFDTKPIAPRIGAAWDVRSDHRTVLRGHYGRYHDMLFSQIYTWYDRAGITPRIRTIQVAPGEFVEQSRGTPEAIDKYPIAPGLKQSYVDQFSTGIEHQVSRHLAIEARYVARRFRNFIGYVDRRIDEWTPFTATDPGPDGRIGTPDDGGVLTGFVPYAPPPDLVIDNPEGASRQYDAIQAIVRKRQADNWELQASYTWSRTRGTIPGQDGSNATLGYLSPGGYGAVPGGASSLRNTQFSRSQFEHRELKVLGWVRLPGLGGTVAGGVFRRHNGQRWHRSAFIEDTSIGWAAFVPAEEPFSRITPTLNLFDLRLEKTLVRGSRQSLGLYLDILNVLNAGEARSYISSGPYFGLPNAWTDPRTMRLGLRYTY